MHAPHMFAIGLLALGIAKAAHADATACLVLGDKAAQVQSMEGKRSPVFVTQACSALRLLRGQAQASWIGHNGKPYVVPITAAGVDDVPQVGAEEREVQTIWAELTTRRATQQAAFMRGLPVDVPVRVYIPLEGLLLQAQLASAVVVHIRPEPASPDALPIEFTLPKGTALRIPAAPLQPDTSYRLEVEPPDAFAPLWWRTVTHDQAQAIDSVLADIARAVAEPEQQDLLQAMYFAHEQLTTNRDLLVQKIRRQPRH